MYRTVPLALMLAFSMTSAKADDVCTEAAKKK